jgi:hypothetical protein
MMLEVVMASALAVIVLALLVSTQIQVLRNYQRTINHNTASRAAYNALREIREIAQQAVSVTVSGNTATILLPQRDANGRFRTPIQPDTANPVFVQVNFTTGQLRLTSERADAHAADQSREHHAAGRVLHAVFRAAGRTGRRSVPCAPERARGAGRARAAHVVRGVYPAAQRRTELRGGD